MYKESLRQSLTDFFGSIASVQYNHPNSGKKVHDLGLIIFEESSTKAQEEITALLDQDMLVDFSLENSYIFEDFVAKLEEANKQKKWLMVRCQVDPSPTVIQILRQLGEKTELVVAHYRDQELFKLKLDEDTKIVFLIDRKTLEDVITYPYFSELFGPVLSIE